MDIRVKLGGRSGIEEAVLRLSKAKTELGEAIENLRQVCAQLDIRFEEVNEGETRKEISASVGGASACNVMR